VEPRRHVLQHSRAAHPVARDHPDALVQPDRPLVHLVQQRHQDRHLDQRRRRIRLAAADGERLARLEVGDADPRHAGV
ncbi:MAG: hypothetical protein AVDCRST_MAG68-754, partial [uncultured Gemmatimonadetes bacterium]